MNRGAGWRVGQASSLSVPNRQDACATFWGSWKRSSMRKVCRRWIRYRVEFSRPAMAKPQREEPDNAERTVNQPPINGNPAQPAEEKCVRHNEDAGNHAELEQPD